MKFRFYQAEIDILVDLSTNKFIFNEQNRYILFEASSWDDYCYRTTFEAYLATSDAKRDYLGTVNIAERNAEAWYDNSSPKIYKTFDKISSKEVEQLPKGFITLGNESFYLNLHKHFTLNECEDILRRMNDICYEFDESLANELLELKVIRKSFFRDLAKEEMVRKIEVLQPIVKNGKRNGYDIRYTYSMGEKEISQISFITNSESVFPQNVHAIIGNNGSGKTTFIKDILFLSIRQELEIESEFTIDNQCLRVSFDADSKNVKVSKPSDYFSKTIFVSFSPFDKLFLNDGASIEETGKVKYLGLYQKGQVPLNFEDLLSIFEDTIHKIVDKRDDWKFFKEILSIQDYQGDVSPLMSKIENAVQASDTDRAELSEIFTKLSAGQKIILLSIATLIAEVEQYNLVLIDEPELFLHPPMISNYIRSINKIMERKNGLCILTTHSPIIVQEIPKNCIKLIQPNDENFIDMLEPEYETLGENLSTLTNTIFGLNQYESGFYKLIKEMINRHSEDNVEEIQNLVFGRDGMLYKNLLLSEVLESEDS